jgi:hypothetical protein
MLRRPGANLEAGGRKCLWNLVRETRLEMDEPAGRMEPGSRDGLVRV